MAAPTGPLKVVCDTLLGIFRSTSRADVQSWGRDKLEAVARDLQRTRGVPRCAARLLQELPGRSDLDARQLCELLCIPALWRSLDVPSAALSTVIRNRAELVHHANSAHRGRYSLLDRRLKLLGALTEICDAAMVIIQAAGQGDAAKLLQVELKKAETRLRGTESESRSDGRSGAGSASDDALRHMGAMQEHVAALLAKVKEGKSHGDELSAFKAACYSAHSALLRATEWKGAIRHARADSGIGDGAARKLTAVLHSDTAKLPLEAQDALFSLVADAAELDEHVALYLTATGLNGAGWPSCPLKNVLATAQQHINAVASTLGPDVCAFLSKCEQGASAVFVAEEPERDASGKLLQLRAPSAREAHAGILRHLVRAVAFSYRTSDQKGSLERLGKYFAPQHVPLQIADLVADAYVLSVMGLDRTLASHASLLLRAASDVDQRVLCGMVYSAIACEPEKDFMTTTKQKAPAPLERMQEALSSAVLHDVVGAFRATEAAEAAASSSAEQEVALYRAEVAAFIARDAFAQLVKSVLPPALTQLQAGQAALVVALQNATPNILPYLAATALRNDLAPALPESSSAASAADVDDEEDDDQENQDESEDGEEEEKDEPEQKEEELDERRDAFGVNVRQSAAMELLHLLSREGHVSRWRASCVTLLCAIATKFSGGSADTDLSKEMTGRNLQYLHNRVMDCLNASLGGRGDSSASASTAATGGSGSAGVGSSAVTGTGPSAASKASTSKQQRGDQRAIEVANALQQAETRGTLNTQGDSAIRSVRQYSAYGVHQMHRGGSRIEIACELPVDLFQSPNKLQSTLILDRRHIAPRLLELALEKKQLQQEEAERFRVRAGISATTDATREGPAADRALSLGSVAREDLNVKRTVDTFLKSSRALKQPPPQLDTQLWRDALGSSALSLKFEDANVTYKGKDRPR
jgi:hypothetical protein